MTKRTWLFVMVGAVVVGLAVGGWWWYQAGERQQLISDALPPLPDLSASPAAMAERLAAADTKARSRTGGSDAAAELAQLYQANGFLEQAIGCYELLQRLQPEEPRWWHLPATILSGYGEAERALQSWQRMLELAPDYIPARLKMAECLLKADRTAEAVEAYESVLKREPNQPYALFGLARVDLEAGRWDQARQRLESVVAQTNYQLGYDLIVTLYERLGMKDRARAIRGAASASGAYRDPVDPWLDALDEYCYDPFRLSLMAGAAAGTGQPAHAQRLLERAIEITPNDVAMRFQLGTLAVEQGNMTLAADQFQRCTILAPDFADAWAHWSSLEARRGDTAAADRILANGLRNCPQSPGLHLMKARDLRKAGRAEAALNEFMISARLRPNEPDAYIELGNTLISLNRVAEGVEQLKAALNAEPEHPGALSILAFHAITTGDESEANRWLARIAAQPRVTQDRVNQLLAVYRKQFGREFNLKQAQ